MTVRLAAVLAAAVTCLVLAPTALAAPAPVPCTAIGGGKYSCDLAAPADGRTAGAKVMVAGRIVGYLHKGTNWIVCQQRGALTRNAAGNTNTWYGWTQSDHGGAGWASAVEARGGDDNGQFRGVPDCKGAHGPAPSWGGVWGADHRGSRSGPPSRPRPRRSRPPSRARPLPVPHCARIGRCASASAVASSASSTTRRRSGATVSCGVRATRSTRPGRSASTHRPASTRAAGACSGRCASRSPPRGSTPPAGRRAATRSRASASASSAARARARRAARTSTSRGCSAASRPGRRPRGVLPKFNKTPNPVAKFVVDRLIAKGVKYLQDNSLSCVFPGRFRVRLEATGRGTLIHDTRAIDLGAAQDRDGPPGLAQRLRRLARDAGVRVGAVTGLKHGLPRCSKNSRATSSPRVLTPTFSKIAFRWSWTVHGERCSRAAMASVGSPRATSCVTVRSRSVSRRRRRSAARARAAGPARGSRRPARRAHRRASSRARAASGPRPCARARGRSRPSGARPSTTRARGSATARDHRREPRAAPVQLVEPRARRRRRRARSCCRRRARTRPVASSSAPARPASAASSIARRSPSARCRDSEPTTAASAGAKCARSAPRNSVSAPQVAVSSTSAARSSSPKPFGPRISR